MRRLVPALLLAAVAGIPALSQESQLVVGSGNPPVNPVVFVDPSQGVVMLMDVEQNGTKSHGWHSFLADLTRSEKVTRTVGTKSYSTLRLGSENVVPTVEGYIELFPEKPTSKDDAGKDGPRKRIRDAEDAFWDKLPAYDGKIATAFNGTYLLLALPSRHALLFYEQTSNKIELRGWYNYGPLLYTATGWQSSPSPSQLAKSLVLDDEQRKALEGALADKEGQIASLAPSDVWAVASGNTFAVVDSANRVMFSLQFTGKKINLMSVRNLSVDLLAPGFQTLPVDADAAKQFLSRNATVLKDLGIAVFDPPYVKALLAAAGAGEAAKGSDMHANYVAGQMVLDFPAAHKVMTYDLSGAGNGIELKSVRDLTFDAGLALVERLVGEKRDARDALKAAEKSAAAHKTEDCQHFLELALALDPELFPAVEKSSLIKTELGKTPAWATILEQGAKSAADAKAKKDAIEAAAKAERERKAAAKKAAK